MITVVLTDEELEEIERIAEDRCARKEASGECKSKKILASRSDVDTVAMGLKGEFAVAKHYGVEVDTDFHVGPDRGWDVRLPQGTVEVKTTIEGKGRAFALRTSNPRHLTAKFGILALLRRDGRTVILAGAISRERFIQIAQTMNFNNHGPRAAVPRWRMFPVETLLPKIEHGEKAGS